MDLSTLIVSVFCLTDDWLKNRNEPLRRRGPAPKLSDSEVLTIEVVGEFLGIDTDAALHRFFSRHYTHFFPALREVHRTTFAPQAANLWAAKEALWHQLSSLEGSLREPRLLLVDSFPVPACRPGRSHRCRVLQEVAARGYDESGGGFFYGVRAHLLVRWPGVVCGLCLAPANIHDLRAAEELLLAETYNDTSEGWVLGDRNYHSPSLAQQLHHKKGLVLLTPHKTRKNEQQPWPLWLVQKRRRVETVIGQLVGRYNAKKVWARDAWHLASRFLRKVLSHTIAVLLCQENELPPLRFSELLTH